MDENKVSVDEENNVDNNISDNVNDVQNDIVVNIGNDRKKKFIFIGIILFICVLFFVIYLFIKPSGDKLKELPKPEITGGMRGELGIDKNINESNIDEYLGRSDSVYRDMRMLEDPGNYESIGGDRFLSGYVDGFEVIPLPYIIPVTGLPDSVGETYTGTTLFYNDNGRYIANYEESMDIIEKIFPKDKVIFLMCGGGGYAGMTKNFLVSLGWDENKIYNVGGYWYYNGEHNIEVKKEVDGVVSYDFDSVPYHNIEFNKLTKASDYKAPYVKVSELKLNTYSLDLEEGSSFKLDVIVLPNDSSSKEVIWSSGNSDVASVNDGVVSANGVGSAVITATSIDGSKSVSCEINVSKKRLSIWVDLSDISVQASEFNSYDIDKLHDDFDDKVYNSDYTFKDDYCFIDSDGYCRANDLWNEEYDKYTEKKNFFIEQRVNILNKLIDENNTFIILVRTKDCGSRDYSIIDGAEKILKENNIIYLYTGTSPQNGDETLEKINIDFREIYSGIIVFIKNGEVYAKVDPNVDSLKSDEDVKNWLSNYIDI